MNHISYCHNFSSEGYPISCLGDTSGESSFNEKSRSGKESTFINGKILRVFPGLRTVVIISYASVERKEFILSGLSFDGEPLWQLGQSQLMPKGPLPKEDDFERASYSTSS